MLTRDHVRRCALAAALLACGPVEAAEPSFDELLAQAQAQDQVPAGYLSAPHGDKVGDTLLALYKLVPTATPHQLKQLSALLHRDLTEQKTFGESSPIGVLSSRTAPSEGPIAKPAEPLDSVPAEQPRHLGTLSPPRPAPARGVSVSADPVGSATDSHVADLFAKGQAAEDRGDISGARRFYSGAARKGHAAAARNLGRLYDPVYVGQAAISGIDADPALASHWYGLAAALGDAQAVPLLQALTTR